MLRVFLGLSLAILIVIAAARVAYSVSTRSADYAVNEAWSHNKMEFVAWNKERWTAWIHDGVFELAPENTADWSRHANATISYADWDGEFWQARIDGEVFFARREGQLGCAARASGAIRFRDWLGNKQLRTVADLER